MFNHCRSALAGTSSVKEKLINMYVKCGELADARKVFNDMKNPNSFSWNVIIAAYQMHGYPSKALTLFNRMQGTNAQPNHFTIASILPACAKISDLEMGMEIHQRVIEKEFLSDVVVATALLDMYAKCGSIRKARALFDKMPQRNMITWNAMIAGYTQNGVLDEALNLFKEMPQTDVISWNTMIAGYLQNRFDERVLEVFRQMQIAGSKPNSATFASVLPACAKLGALAHGVKIHRSIIERGYSADVVVASALVDMYAKCGSIQKARELFDKIPQRNVVSWNTMMTGYAQNGFVEKALETFKEMQSAGVKADSITFSCILTACAQFGTLDQGRTIHQSIIESGFWSDVIVANALIDMYAKCGTIKNAREVFDGMRQRNVVSWTAMIAGYAQNGFTKDALQHFELMKNSGTCPDSVSFACILFACSHAGLVHEGCKYLNDISESYCLTHTMDHYVCMVDLLGRAGYLEEDFNFIVKMPIKPDVVVWMCLLGACRSHKDKDLGIFASTLLLELDPNNMATYVLLANVYAEMGRWDEAQEVWNLMKDRGIRKSPGCSWIEGHKLVHAFCA